MDILKNIKAKFEELFGNEGEIKEYFAPGRVNLIGEHTDYNGGHVFPCTLTIGTYAIARKRNDNKLRFYSLNFDELGVLESTIDELQFNEKENWINYPKSIIWSMKDEGYNIDKGLDVLFYGTIPNGAGLSSSASMEVLTGFILKDMFNLDVNMTKLAMLGQKAENKYIGVNCGIMDQFIIANGKKDSAIFLDTSNLKYEYAPIILKNKKIIIMNTNKQRGLGDSKYNERRAECEEALRKLQTKLDIKSLGELTEEQFEKNKYLIKDEKMCKRAKHAVYENQRTIKAVKALETGNLEMFGKLMIDSHNSLRDDYEVTGKELDTLVSESLKQEGVIGARMTGAGFGGCAVSIVETDKIDIFIKNVGQAYKNEIGYDADFYIVEIGDGPRIIKE